jgi:hypothetical protein
MPNPLHNVLRQPAIKSIRRNHALEHATIHILSRRYPRASFIGRSDARGFFIYGEVSSEDLASASTEALSRLRAGDHTLAIHPNCGTNLVTAGMLAGTASFLSFLGSKENNWRNRLERLPLAIVATMLAILIAQPIGKAAQRHITTESDPGTLEIVDIKVVSGIQGPVHRVLTKY